MKIVTVIVALLLVVLGALAFLIKQFISMPGHSYSGTLPPLTGEERDLASALEKHVNILASGIGPRSLEAQDGLRAAERYIVEELRNAGCEPAKESFIADDVEVSNYFVEFPGSSAALFVIGAHYDTVGKDTPGANDNGSGVAAALELAKRFRREPAAATVRISFFVNEELPYSATELMGSMVHAKRLLQSGQQVRGMVSLETIGCYSETPGSQHYPRPFSTFYPQQGNFIAIVGNTASRDLVRGLIAAFRKTTKFPSEGLAAPSAVRDAGRSDHASFWTHGFQAVMITDTAPFRYPHYHRKSDTAEKVDYGKTARVTLGIERAVRAYLQAG